MTEGPESHLKCIIYSALFNKDKFQLIL